MPPPYSNHTPQALSFTGPLSPTSSQPSPPRSAPPYLLLPPLITPSLSLSALPTSFTPHPFHLLSHASLSPASHASCSLNHSNSKLQYLTLCPLHTTLRPLHTTPLTACPAPPHGALSSKQGSSLLSPAPPRPSRPRPLTCQFLLTAHSPQPGRAAGSSRRLTSGILTLRLHTESRVRPACEARQLGAVGSLGDLGDPCTVPGDAVFAQLLASSP